MSIINWTNFLKSTSCFCNWFEIKCYQTCFFKPVYFSVKLILLEAICVLFID